PRVTGAAPEFLREPEGPGPLGDVGKDDARAVVAPLLAYGGLDGGDVRRVEVRVRDHDDPEAVLPQAARDVDEQRSHGSGPERHRAGESGGELGGGEIGRASCRERVEVSVVGGVVKKKRRYVDVRKW